MARGMLGWGWSMPVAAALAVAAAAAALVRSVLFTSWFWSWVYGINTVALIVCAVDKTAARRGMWRFPERGMLAVAAVGGAPGMLAGMLLVRHKTRKRGFILVLALVIAVQAVIVAEFVR